MTTTLRPGRPAALALLALLALLSLPARAEPPRRLAVMDVRCEHADQSPELARTLTDVVAFELGEGGRYRVVTTQDLAAAAKLKGLQQGVGCTSVACEAELGQAADVEQFVSGSVGRLGSRLVVILKLMDARTVTVVRQVRQVVPADEDALFDLVTRAARDLVAAPAPAPMEPPGAAPEFGGPGLSGGGSDKGIGPGAIGTVIGDGSGRGARARQAREAPTLSRDDETTLARALARRLAARRSHPGAR